MKKFLTAIFAGILAVASLFTFTACGAKDVKIGVQEGTTSLMYAECLKGVKVSSYETFPLATTAMLNGNIDYVMCDKATATSICNTMEGVKYVDIAFSTEYYGIAMDKNQPELNTAINNIVASKSAEIQAIIDKYMANDVESYVGVTSATKNNANQAGQLVVATNAEFPPWEYYEDEKYFGIDMEIAKLIADELDLELVIDDMPFASVVTSVGANGVDIAMSGITITNERKEIVNFSESYYTESIVLLCKESDYADFASAGTVVDLLNILCANK